MFHIVFNHYQAGKPFTGILYRRYGGKFAIVSQPIFFTVLILVCRKPRRVANCIISPKNATVLQNKLIVSMDSNFDQNNIIKRKLLCSILYLIILQSGRIALCCVDDVIIGCGIPMTSPMTSSSAMTSSRGLLNQRFDQN